MTGTISVTQRPCPTPSVCSRISSPVRNGTCRCLTVFRREGDAIRHFWGGELLYVPPEPGQQYRHNDLLDTLWNMLDLTPEGRGAFEPRVKYV